jgi:hypothetical protein
MKGNTMDFSRKIELQQLLGKMIEQHKSDGCNKRANKKGKDLPPLHYLVYTPRQTFTITCGNKGHIPRSDFVVCRLGKDCTERGPTAEEYENLARLMDKAKAGLESQVHAREEEKERKKKGRRLCSNG